MKTKFEMEDFRNFLQKTGLCEEEDSFYVCQLDDVVRKLARWYDCLPTIKPFYAVKCNNDPRVLKLMVKAGMCFDCASISEIKSVMALGADSSQIVFANPCKQISAIRYARAHDVPLMTFDNHSELLKIKREFPGARLLLRVLPPTNGKVRCNLGLKFGCSPEDVAGLLSAAKSLGLNLVGISFHVGSGCEDESLYWHAVKTARDAFRAASELGFCPYLLDIGGGFPGADDSPVSFPLIADFINDALRQFFPSSDFPDLSVIAEPGRFFVASAYTLVTRVISRREVGGKMMYYLNDGVYGAFNCVMYDHATIVPSFPRECQHNRRVKSDLWGPTCDSIDCVLENVDCPLLEVGDRVVFSNMGAYTLVAASKFNGMSRAKCYYCDDLAQVR